MRKENTVVYIQYIIIGESFEKTRGQTQPKLQITGAGKRDSFVEFARLFSQMSMTSNCMALIN